MITKLIMVEGIPGSGKSTTALKIKEYFDSLKIPSRLYLESDCCNPTDYAWVSVVAEDEYDSLITDYPEYSQFLEQFSEKADGRRLIYYHKMENQSGTQFPEGMLSFLSAHEPYDGKVSSDMFMELHLNRYQQFSEKAVKLEEISIFESSYLQNIVNELLGHQNLSKSTIIEYLWLLAQKLKALNPVLIYLTQPDVCTTIRRVADERRSPDKSMYPDWIDHVINYFSNSKFGHENSLIGFEGVVEFFRRRKEIEIEAIGRLDMCTIVIENCDYNKEKGLGKVVEALSNLGV